MSASLIRSKARWKMKHDAILPPTTPTVHGLSYDIARVGLTFRYVRRSFLELSHASELPSPALPLPLKPMDLCDAFFYDADGRRSSAHLYTYPAVVLDVDHKAQLLELHYLCDGLIADADDEAFRIVKGVPASAALLATPDVRSWLDNSQCSWTRRSYRKLTEIRERFTEIHGDSRSFTEIRESWQYR